ncbi:hypothetical protein [Crossiella sp. CA198]|uniref:hypothetical protein n=1 Tax=Crossiella sp. CA198 TaxID=3455607 RepID=UPI003F8D6823
MRKLYPPAFDAVFPVALDASGQLWDEHLTVDVPDEQPDTGLLVRLFTAGLDHALVLNRASALGLAAALTAAVATIEANLNDPGESPR